MQLDHDRLDHGGQRDRVVDARLGIADAELERVEKRMEPDVPPDLFRVVDAVGLDQELQIILILGEALETDRECRCAESARRCYADRP